MLSKMATLASSVAVAACSVVGVRDAEEPAHSVVARMNGVEIRTYAPRIAAETTIDGTEMGARSTGFRRIAAYIFGENTTGGSVAMTAPVAQAGGKSISMTAPVAQGGAGEDGWTIRFFMPAKYTLETLPQPKNPLVRLVPVPAETMAVLRFSGATDPATVAARQTDLREALRSTIYKPVGGAVAWFYDPPWTLPPFRRNEVAVRVSDTTTPPVTP